MLKNTKTSFGTVTIAFHWAVAILAIGMLVVGFYMEGLDRLASNKFQLYMLHKSTGLVVGIIIIAKGCWQFFNVKPSVVAMPRWQELLATSVQHSLMLLMLLMVLTGYAMATAKGRNISFYNLFDIPAVLEHPYGKICHSMHGFLAYVLASLVVLHVLAALKHHFIDKDDVLKSMLKFK